MMNYINHTVLPHLVDQYNHSGDVFEKKLLIKNPTTLKEIVDKLSKINLMDADSDVKGDAFEYFLKNSITVGNDLGEYFTPRHIVNLMIELIEPKFGEKIYDPTCGTGGFLIATFNYIKKRISKTKDNYQKLKEDAIFGREITKNSKIAKMNMILTGDGHTNIEEIDSLASPKKDEFEVVLANPPYGQTTKFGSYYPVSSNNGDAIFIQHIIMSLKDDGRSAVVIPEGLLFAKSEKEVRKYMLKNCNILAIISLPQGVFRPYAHSKTNIIIFERNQKGTQSIWFYNLEADGFALTSDFRKPIDENDIPDLLDNWKDKPDTKKSWNVDLETIIENDYDLLVKTYRPKKEYQSEFAETKFSTIMKENKETIVIDDDKEYKRLNVKWYGQGIFLRDTVLGKKIKTKKQKLVQSNQFIVAEIDAKDGSFGTIPSELEGAIVSSHYFLFDLDQSKIIPQYFDYMTRYGHYTEMIQPYVKGTTNYSSIRPKDILELTIPLPDIDTQQLIVDRIQKQEIIINNVKNTIKSLEDGIIDKSDFEGEWKYEELESVCKEIKSGSTPSRSVSSYYHGDINWLKSGELEDGTIEKTEEKLTKEGYNATKLKIFPKETVVIALYGATIGKTGLLKIETTVNQAIAGLIPKTSLITSEFLQHYLISLRSYYLQQARGIAQKNINGNILKSVKIPVPPIKIQKEIIHKINERKKILLQLSDSQKRAEAVITQIVDSVNNLK